MKVEWECYRFIQTIAILYIKVGPHLWSGLDILQIKHLGKFFQRKRGWHNLIYESFVQSNVETKYYVNHTKFSNMHHGVGMVL